MQVQALFSHGQLPISRHPLCRNPDSGQGANADKPQPGTEVRDAANAAHYCSKPLSKQVSIGHNPRWDLLGFWYVKPHSRSILQSLQSNSMYDRNGCVRGLDQLAKGIPKCAFFFAQSSPSVSSA